MQVLLYTKDAHIDDAAKAEMVKAGYVPILVDDLFCTKILPLQVAIPQAHMDLICASAIKAIANYPNDVIRTNFGAIIANAITAAHKP